LPEVVEYDSFIAASGMTGGWHPDDHSQFLQILQTARGDVEACKLAASAQLFHIQPEEIEAHAE
jgi:hypothetical protein